MVRVTDFARPKRTYDKDDLPRRPLPPQDSAYQSQRPSRNPRSEARRLKRKSLRESDKECFVCRETGHLSQDCPQNIGGEVKTEGGRICYRCGRIDHSLKECKKAPMKRKGGREDSVSESEDEGKQEQEYLPYANCYVCHKSGHLAGSCPKNERGIYPNGGSCKLCGILCYITLM
jgi:zinc finger CCHC domain-containing protein 9